MEYKYSWFTSANVGTEGDLENWKTTKQQELNVFEGKRVSTEERAKVCWPIRCTWKIRLQWAKCMKFCKSERMLTSASGNCLWSRNMSALYSNIWKFVVCHSDRKSPVCCYQGLSSNWDSVRTESDQARGLWRQRIKIQDHSLNCLPTQPPFSLSLQLGSPHYFCILAECQII